MAACLTAFLLTFDVKVSLNDEKITTAEVFSDFKDPGAKGYITISKLGFKKEIKVKTENDIEVTKLGEYRIEYLVSFLWK